jgi:hypothetical protein
VVKGGQVRDDGNSGASGDGDCSRVTAMSVRARLQWRQ